MVFELYFCRRPRPENLSQRLPSAFVAALGMIAGASLSLASPAQAADPARARESLREAQTLYQAGQFFKAARYAFEADAADSGVQSDAYSWICLSLIRSGLYNSATYFFIKTLQSGDKAAIRRVLTHTQDLLVHAGDDVLRKYLIRHTTYEDYDAMNRSAYLYSLGKTSLLGGHDDQALGYLNAISSESPFYPYALQLMGTSNAIAGHSDEAIRNFKACEKRADSYASGLPRTGSSANRQARNETMDLRARCLAGEARTLYETKQYKEADRAYDRIPKASFVYTDILFEHAWNSFALEQYNRTLGKLVSYKSPALSFVFNPEVDVLRAQTFLMLCLYNDANDVINEFNTKYSKVGEEVKRFTEANASNLRAFYELGKEALIAPLHTGNDFHRLSNRFVRGPYFQNMVASERAISRELASIHTLDFAQAGVQHNTGGGFPGFLEVVLRWRAHTIQLVGGAYVKNSLLDYHASLISDFEKMAFIKLEMLARAKERLIFKRPALAERSRGNVEPSRRDDQYYWSFNGEFWNDELGDYVFGLESECNKS